jgi:hypothetical protein
MFLRKEVVVKLKNNQPQTEVQSKAKINKSGLPKTKVYKKTIFTSMGADCDNMALTPQYFSLDN